MFLSSAPSPRRTRGDSLKYVKEAQPTDRVIYGPGSDFFMPDTPGDANEVASTPEDDRRRNALFRLADRATNTLVEVKGVIPSITNGHITIEGEALSSDPKDPDDLIPEGQVTITYDPETQTGLVFAKSDQVA